MRSHEKNQFCTTVAAIAARGGARVGRGRGRGAQSTYFLAVAEKVSALRTESYIAERTARANIPMALDILKRAGVGRRRTETNPIRERGGQP
jgi:hypothetical protein